MEGEDVCPARTRKKPGVIQAFILYEFVEQGT